MQKALEFLKSYKPLILTIILICLLTIGMREIKALIFIIALELSALFAGFGAAKTIAKSSENSPIRDGMIFLGSQLCVGFCAIGVYFLQFE